MNVLLISQSLKRESGLSRSIVNQRTLEHHEKRFKAAMLTLRKDHNQYFNEWEDTIIDTAKDVWLEIINEGDPKDDGSDFLRDKEGLIKALKQYLFWYCPDTNSRLMQLRATMLGTDFKFTRGTNVATHAARYALICKYMKRLPGDEELTERKIKLLAYDSFPKTWEESFISWGLNMVQSKKAQQ